MSNFHTNDNRSMTNTANLQGAKVDNSITYVRGLSDEAFTTSLNSIGSMVNSISDANLQAVRAIQQKDLVSESIRAKTNQQAINNAINTTNKNLGNLANNALNRLEVGSKRAMALIIALAGLGAILWIANKKGLLK